MSNVTIGINAALLDRLAAQEVPTLAGEHKLRSAGLVVVYDTAQPPRFVLPQGDKDRARFRLTLSQVRVNIYRSSDTGRTRLIRATFDLTLHGVFTLTQDEEARTGQIGMTIRKADVSGAGLISRSLLRAALNYGVIPAVKERLPAIVVPDLRELLGFAVQIDRVKTAHGLLYLLMTVPGAPAPEMPPLIRMETTTPTLLVHATDSAITASQRDFRLKEGVDEDTRFPLPMGVNLGFMATQLVGYVQADHLRVRVRGGEPSCTVRLTASAGLRMKLWPFGRFDMALTPYTQPPRFSVTLRTSRDGQRLSAAVQLEHGALVDWSLAGVPRLVQPVVNPLLRELLHWVDQMMAPVYDALDLALRQIRIPIVSLNDFPLPLRFQSTTFEDTGLLVRLVWAGAEDAPRLPEAAASDNPDNPT